MSCQRDKNALSTRLMKMETILGKCQPVSDREYVTLRMLSGEMAACCDCLTGHLVICSEMDIQEIDKRLSKRQ